MHIKIQLLCKFFAFLRSRFCVKMHKPRIWEFSDMILSCSQPRRITQSSYYTYSLWSFQHPSLALHAFSFLGCLDLQGLSTSGHSRLLVFSMEEKSVYPDMQKYGGWGGYVASHGHEAKSYSGKKCFLSIATGDSWDSQLQYWSKQYKIIGL